MRILLFRSQESRRDSSRAWFFRAPDISTLRRPAAVRAVSLQSRRCYLNGGPSRPEAPPVSITPSASAVQGPLRAERMASLTLRVKVKPKARTSSLEQLPDGTWLAKLKSPPVDGKANQELVALVADRFHCRKAAVHVKAGASGRMKLLEVERE